MARRQPCPECGTPNEVTKRTPAGRCPHHRIAPAPYFRQPVRLEIWRKYDGVCQLCFEEIVILRGRHPRALSIHHVVSRALGGGHNEANLVPAHIDCNTRAGSDGGG